MLITFTTGKNTVIMRGKPRCKVIAIPVNLWTHKRKTVMNDLEIISLPEWDEAFDESIANLKRKNSKEPTLVELQNLIEVLINHFRTAGKLCSL